MRASAGWVRFYRGEVAHRHSRLTRLTGKRHAVNFHELTARAHVVAAFTPDEEERKWGAEHLEGVKIYRDYDEMLDEDLDAVVVASVTAVNAAQAIKAINKGYHVLCEKPLSIDIEIVGSWLSDLCVFTVLTSFYIPTGPICC